MKLPPAVADAICRERMFAFLMRAFAYLHPDDKPLEPAWYLKAMCHWLERTDAGELPRSMIWIQPRTLKSFTVAIAYPALARCWQARSWPAFPILPPSAAGEVCRHGSPRGGLHPSAPLGPTD